MTTTKLSETQKMLLIARVENTGRYAVQGYKGAENKLRKLGYIKSEYVGNLCKTWVTEEGMAAYNAIKGIADKTALADSICVTNGTPAGEYI